MQIAANDDHTFEHDLLALIPQLRAFARTLSHHREEADDLAQDTLTKALQSRSGFTPGTNMKAWTFMILRNQFYSEKRRSWRSLPLDQQVAEETLEAVSDPTANLQLDELRRAMGMLPEDQREALVLIGAAGMSYEEASEICGVPIGTIKSRVSRARARLSLIFAGERIEEDGQRPQSAAASIMGQIHNLSDRAQRLAG